MADCEYLAACPIFGKFKLEGIKNFWIKLYCKGAKQARCARRILKESGKPIPETLLPSGMHLDAFGD